MDVIGQVKMHGAEFLVSGLLRLQRENLWRRHRLRFVTSSQQCDLAPRLPQTPLQAVVDGDAMAADVPQVIAMQERQKYMTAESETDARAMEALAKIEPLRSKTKKSSASSLSPAETVAASLASAASAAATAATAAAGSMYSAAAPISFPIASNISAFTSSVASPVKNMSSQFREPLLDRQEQPSESSQDLDASQHLSARLTAGCGTSPTAWYIADDEEQKIRYFVLQGSDNIDHWRVNLTFDPVTFEDPSLGIKVHRGVYETAKQFYDRFLPLVQEHLASGCGRARIAFTGHSLGGSLGTLLLLMYVHRGVLKPEEVAPIYTFGSPAIFCECCSGKSCCSMSMSENKAPERAPKRADQAEGQESQLTDLVVHGLQQQEHSEGILKRFGLSQDHVRNILMHKDIVPRAFACDYSLVAELLRAVGGSFREHQCLQPGDRRMLFNFIGSVMILQPGAKGNFVYSEGYHPMLPERPGLFLLRNPSIRDQSVPHNLGNAAERMRKDLNSPALANTKSFEGNKPIDEPDGHVLSVSNACRTKSGMDVGDSASCSSRKIQSLRNNSRSLEGKGGGLEISRERITYSDNRDHHNTQSLRRRRMPRQSKKLSEDLKEVHEAVWHFMNNPHPLDILADPGAYGDSGSISRYHNPDHYTKALGMALRIRGPAWRNIVMRAEKSGLQVREPQLSLQERKKNKSRQPCDGRHGHGGKAARAPVYH